MEEDEHGEMVQRHVGMKLLVAMFRLFRSELRWRRSQPKLAPDTGWSLRKSEMCYDGSASVPSPNYGFGCNAEAIGKEGSMSNEIT